MSCVRSIDGNVFADSLCQVTRMRERLKEADVYVQGYHHHISIRRYQDRDCKELMNG